jgi:hypothetical protein
MHPQDVSIQGKESPTGTAQAKAFVVRVFSDGLSSYNLQKSGFGEPFSVIGVY